ncbi:hypothetical protein KL86DYS1_12201 [uncultured Dysgonomonas sp.]|uniref:Uncharacterized protein n=1 Tax=uncultured Dysgonomonas sp. TaxID=206096 RepID=A0A212JGI0_9BACT|nr:hypothetical protein KL86DYS1_12201 [uncultured Dysgonomonas sp.]
MAALFFDKKYLYLPSQNSIHAWKGIKKKGDRGAPTSFWRKILWRLQSQ